MCCFQSWIGNIVIVKKTTDYILFAELIFIVLKIWLREPRNWSAKQISFTQQIGKYIFDDEVTAKSTKYSVNCLNFYGKIVTYFHSGNLAYSWQCNNTKRHFRFFSVHGKYNLFETRQNEHRPLSSTTLCVFILLFPARMFQRNEKINRTDLTPQNSTPYKFHFI